jgi:hypothetical protein
VSVHARSGTGIRRVPQLLGWGHRIRLYFREMVSDYGNPTPPAAESHAGARTGYAGV